jgi:hypothetical protein
MVMDSLDGSEASEAEDNQRAEVRKQSSAAPRVDSGDDPMMRRFVLRQENCIFNIYPTKMK